MMNPDRLLYCTCCDTHDFDADDCPVLGPAVRRQVRLMTQWLGPILRFQPLAGINQVPNRMPALSLAAVAGTVARIANAVIVVGSSPAYRKECRHRTEDGERQTQLCSDNQGEKVPSI